MSVSLFTTLYLYVFITHDALINVDDVELLNNVIIYDARIKQRRFQINESRITEHIDGVDYDESRITNNVVSLILDGGYNELPSEFISFLFVYKRTCDVENV